MKLLFATKNPAKVKRYEEGLKKNGIEILTIKDLDNINVTVNETGKNAIENAYIKAKAYYEATGMVTIGIDDNLFIDDIPEEKQPGTHVRRVNGKELTDDEMIEYYTGLVKEYGIEGKLKTKWKYGLVIYNGKETKEYSWSKDSFYFVEKPSEKRNPGYPLDSISVLPETNQYWVELLEEEKNNSSRNNNDEQVIDFIVKNVK